ncbi:hypothetical protein [Fervidobacterium pennivorans]|uniref:hypothetical protein n=1 Tax=Fervidobacterium pennivorans TaxID=93466 RepID=UPI001B7FEE78|nr:hypothetical protein [Fervidobacterium pennivorans]
MKKSFLVLAFFLTFVSAVALSGVLHFEHADIVYPEGYEENAKLVGKIFENVRQQVIELIGNDPGRITIILQDKGTVSNGFTNPLFHRTITLYMWPPESWISFELPLEDWYTYLIIHEFTHMVHLTYQDEFTQLVSILMGFPYLPQMNGPFGEGTTVFAESAFSKNSGRLNNPYVSDGLYYYTIQNFPSFTYKEIMPPDDFRGGQLYYNFTAGFYKYLVDSYGIEKMKRYIALTSTILPDVEIGLKYRDIFEKVFGKPFDELYTDWIRSLMKLNYSEGDLIYKAPNAKIYKLDLLGEKLGVYCVEFGPATSYIGSVNPRLVFLSKDGKEQGSKTVIALDIKYDKDKTYVLTKAENFGKYENQIWEITSNKLIAKGNISAFDVDDGYLYIAQYDAKKMKTRVSGQGLELSIEKYVAYMDVNNGKLAMLTSDYEIIVYDLVTKNTVVLEDDAMKGPYVRFWGNGLLFTRVDGKYVNPYYYDLTEMRLYKLGEDMLVYDFAIEGEDIYYVSYIPYSLNTGTGVYKSKIVKTESNLVKYEYKYEFIDKEFKSGSELSFRIEKMIKPLTWIPMYEYNIDSDEHRGYMIFTFGNIENDTFLIVTPIFDLKLTDTDFNLTYSQYVSWFTMKDTYELLVSYYYPTSDYNLSGMLKIGGFSLSPITDLYGYFTFGFKSKDIGLLDSAFNLFGLSVPGVYKNNIGAGVLATSYLFEIPYKAQVFMLLSNDKIQELFSTDKLLSNLFTYCYLGMALGRDTTFEAQTTIKVDSLDLASYDVSIAKTLFTDNAFLFGNMILVRNSGLTLGVANPLVLDGNTGTILHGIYGHLFVESYVQGLKVYPSVGLFVPFSELFSEDNTLKYLFYIGINTSPHGLPQMIFGTTVE